MMTPIKPCGLLRRLAAIGYDLLLLAAVDFIATAIILVFTSGVAVESANPFYKLYLLLIAYAYFSWQWTHGGQTLGMRAWKICLYDEHNGPVSWQLATKHFLFAIVSWLLAGSGFIWSLFDPEKRTLHDRWSKTRLLVVQYKKKTTDTGQSTPDQIQNQQGK